jgi:hypothetical protein
MMLFGVIQVLIASRVMQQKDWENLLAQKIQADDLGEHKCEFEHEHSFDNNLF